MRMAMNENPFTAKAFVLFSFVSSYFFLKPLINWTIAGKWYGIIIIMGKENKCFTCYTHKHQFMHKYSIELNLDDLLPLIWYNYLADKKKIMRKIHNDQPKWICNSYYRSTFISWISDKTQQGDLERWCERQKLDLNWILKNFDKILCIILKFFFEKISIDRNDKNLNNSSIKLDVNSSHFI